MAQYPRFRINRKRKKMRSTVFTLSAVGCAFLCARTLRAERPISVCELVDNLDKYRGTMVTVMGEIKTGFETTALYPAACKSKSKDDRPDGWNAIYLTQPDGAPESPATFEMDKDEKERFRVEYKKFQATHSEKDAIPVIIAGKLEATPHHGYGHLNGRVAQIVIKSMRMVTEDQEKKDR
jgi:hypothetical protein